MDVNREQIMMAAYLRNEKRDHCMTCRFLDGPYLDEDPDDDDVDLEQYYNFHGYCHRMPPTGGVDFDEENEIIYCYEWPKVSCEEWCGYHEPRQPEEVPDMPLEIYVVDTNPAEQEEK